MISVIKMAAALIMANSLIFSTPMIPFPKVPYTKATTTPETISSMITVADAVVEKHMSERYYLTKEEIDLIAIVVMAEAEGESVEGQRLVIDTILNRVDHHRFPSTVHDVVYQKGQFTSMTNGRASRCYVKPEIVDLVYEEMANRYNSDVIFFRTGRYSSYGDPLFKVGGHYFSSLPW